jgi:hypothetical protein
MEQFERYMAILNGAAGAIMTALIGLILLINNEKFGIVMFMMSVLFLLTSIGAFFYKSEGDD